MTRPLIGTSWKMNLTSTEAATWFAVATPLLEPLATERDLFVLPPFSSIWVARDALAGSTIAWGGQDIHADDRGAHTGDVSGAMLADLGCRYAEVGHSERRRNHGETDAIVAAKVRAALRWNLVPIVCLGERVRDSVPAAWQVIRRQLEGAFGGLDPTELDHLVVAYEPVWAIGEGAAAADPEHVEAVHVAIDRWLGERGAATRRVLYGGSVDESNAATLLGCSGVSGLFVGRAALDPERFARIAATAIPTRDHHAQPLERSA
jgi:triosephosphate isomerase